MMKLTHVLGYRSKWNLDLYNEQELGDYFLISAHSHGDRFDDNKRITPFLDKAMIDLEFYGKKETLSNLGKLEDFDFHPADIQEDMVTSTYFNNCVFQAIKYQESKGFKNIIIPHFYEEENAQKLTNVILQVNDYLKENRKDGHQYFMTLPFAHQMIKNDEKVESILQECTDMNINFDGYFIVCENSPRYGHKLTVDYELMTNLSRVFRTLKSQDFQTIYAYANFDAIVYLAQTDIDYITIGSFETLRRFNLSRYTAESRGGRSDGHYFSENLLNVIRAADVSLLRLEDALDNVRNQNNIFSDIILDRGYSWSNNRPDIHKNYLLSIGSLLKKIGDIDDLEERRKYVLRKIDQAIALYGDLGSQNIFLTEEGQNYHLTTWKTLLSRVR